MMFNRKINSAALLITLLALCREAVASCSEGQYLSNGTCMNCTTCGARIVLEQCTNLKDTICSICERWQVPNNISGCEFDCTQCLPHGQCVSGNSECSCSNGYSGTTCDTPPDALPEASPTGVASCGERQYLSNGSCVNCATCGQYRILKECTNTTDTVCSPCHTWQISNADGGCDFDCKQCGQHGSCHDNKECICRNGYTGIICDIRPAITTGTTTTTRDPDPEEDDGNRVVLIICIVAASVLALGVVIGIVVAYLTCSKRLSHDSENSDESTYSSASINSRTMLTNDHHHHSNGSLQQSQQTSNGYTYRSTILPPPQPWNNNIASAIR